MRGEPRCLVEDGLPSLPAARARLTFVPAAQYWDPETQSCQPRICEDPCQDCVIDPGIGAICVDIDIQNLYRFPVRGIWGGLHC